MKTEINPPAMSKINATAALQAIGNLLVVLGYVPADVAIEAMAAINIIGPMLIAVFRTWFTKPA